MERALASLSSLLNTLDIKDEFAADVFLLYTAGSESKFLSTFLMNI